MKTKKTIATLFATMLIMVMCFISTKASAQTVTKMKEYCMMKDGKMMHHKDGVSMPMEKDITMKNGTVCMVNGGCVMKDCKKMTMKEGECMEMDGKTGKCKKQDPKVTTYTCSMHPEVTSDKPGKCPKCGMTLIVKK